jgi:phage FluMu protein Com
MPIRFRCQYCSQLLGIARRKAGTPVTCPTCHNQVTVPPGDELDHAATASGESAASPAPAAAVLDTGAPAAAPQLLFEREDFDALLQPGVSMRVPVPPLPARPPSPPSTGYDPVLMSTGHSPDSSSTSSASAGFLLSPARATVLTVAMIVLLALAFGAGLLVGRFAL